jgi:hypothetical protein
MHLSFNLLRIKGFCMFRALLAHPLESLHKRHLVYCVSVGCGTVAVKLRNTPNAVCAATPEDEQVMLETCRSPWFSINWVKSASRWFHNTDCQLCVYAWKSSWKTNPHNRNWQPAAWQHSSATFHLIALYSRKKKLGEFQQCFSSILPYLHHAAQSLRS